jgi:ABC-type ATPase with predicted acetyltransferase domain
MQILKIHKVLDWQPPVTDRAARLMHLFGVRLTRLEEQQLNYKCTIAVGDGQICFITGCSGAGKSILLNGLYEQVPADDRLRLDEIPLSADKPMIDCLMPGEKSVWWITHVLSKAGLSDAFAMLNTPARLSAGEQWRYRLAVALASDKKWIFADEFASSLDRITAQVIAFRLRKLATESKKIFILAACQEDVMPDLEPDVILYKYSNGTTRSVYKDKAQDPNARWR